MKKIALRPENLEVDSFATFPDGDVDGIGCICDVAPCICTRAADCTQP